MNHADASAAARPLADIFGCPRCGATEPLEDPDAIVCGNGHRFPVVNGIPRFATELERDVAQTQRVFDFEHRRYPDSSYTRFEPHLIEQFLKECGLPRDFFAGKRVLDAGCGSGRWTYALAELGAIVVACDLTHGGVEMAHAELGDRPNVQFYQADLFALPFRPQSFDVVVSWGVLHHTPDTRAAFGRLVPLVRSGGTLYVMVYERHSPLMHRGTDAVRAVLRRLPDERRYRVCRLLVLGNRRLYRLASHFLMVSYAGPGSDVDVSTAQFGLFDAYSPRFNHVHTTAEVSGWFEYAGFEQIVPVAAPGRAVRVRGVRSGAGSGPAQA